MLRRTRTDVGRELPALSRSIHHIDADTDALDKIGKSAAELARIILQQGETKRGQKMSASEELSNILRQATGIAKAPYVAEFVRLLVESGEKVVLYGWHRTVYDIWLDRLKDLNPVMYTGSESVTQKEAAKAAFISGASQILIISLRSGAGLDGLQQVCRTVVFGELDWSPGVHEQCVGRIYRDGQPDPVLAYYLLAEAGSDPIVADVLNLKKSQIDGVRDPEADLIETLEVEEGHIKRLAESFLRDRGIPLPVAVDPPT
jgi:SNF2 family DNA or RNA helicase